MTPTTPELSPGLQRPSGRTWRRKLPLKKLGLLLLVLTIPVVALLVVAMRQYRTLADVVDRQLASGPFARTINFYAAPETVSVGDQTGREVVASDLRQSGYRQSPGTARGWFETQSQAIVIHPANGSTGPVKLSFDKRGITAIHSATPSGDLSAFTLQTPLVSNISNGNRERRVFIRFSDLPTVLVNAITSAEDKHFFTHGGYDPLRIAKAMYVDARAGRKEQGASTISMQLARNLYLSPKKRWRRKLSELLISIHLEHALTKQQIFEHYCNEVYLGGYGTYSINGFGEAAHAYFDKEVSRVTLPEAALLAGLIQRPSYFNPFRYPERARGRRNIVLRLMQSNGYLSESELESALAAPLDLRPGQSEVSPTQYSMDLANTEFQKIFEAQATNGITDVYTTIDLRLQRAAESAVNDGMAQVDRLLAKRRKKDGSAARAQAALIAIDPHTGEIKAVVGGRDYSTSQLNRVLAMRPPGSVFKPFVYAAAMNTALSGSGEHVFTPSSMINDEPTNFHFADETYRPGNFGNEFYGTVTLRNALAKSMNVAAVKLAQMVGYDRVVELAKQAGMNEDIRPTPAVALGSYPVSPFEIARAYTIFANNGQLLQLSAIRTISDQAGQSLFQTRESSRPVLDPRVTFLMVDMLQDVLRYGTAAGVRAKGFALPAAGKTGTSHDGWFAGFTSQLLCVVWVGFDDYAPLGLEGAHSALPIWTQFMKNASRVSPYRNARAFAPPAGLVRVSVDPMTGLRATPFCPWTETDFFIAGSDPQQICMIHQDNAIPRIPVQTRGVFGPLNPGVPAVPPPPSLPR